MQLLLLHRLEGAAKYAAEHGFSAFTTTLLASTYQNHEAIAEAAERYAERYGVTFLYRDFRPNFREGTRGPGNWAFTCRNTAAACFPRLDRYQKQIDRDKAKFDRI
ncbi:MAG: epoxyqueuosine reductase QueH [Dysosmobacter sp.]